ncbi:MAG: hypothetical protein P8181_11710, partial [bacterium]
MSTAVLAQKDRAIFWCIVVSVLLHGVFLLPAVRNLIPDDLFKIEEQEIEVPPIEFELVSPPEQPTPTTTSSRYLSTVSSAASDDSPENDDSALPKQEGTIPIPDTPSEQMGAEGGGTSDVPPMPEEVTDLGEAFKRSKFLTQQSPNRAPSFPEENPEFKHEESARASVGGISINTTAWDFAPYLLDLKQRIK